jgi:diphosphomevalonate decarboxylase
MVYIKSIAPTNIAVVKYWGKNPKWEKYLIPLKSSVSFTVQDFYTETELKANKGTGNILFNLNDKAITPEMKEYEYVSEMFGKTFELFPNTKNYDYDVKSKNNFPTAAGYASSASGFAALARALQGAMKELEPDFYSKYMANDKLLSVFARLGSGSATRSIPKKGGFVMWKRGINPKKQGPETFKGEELNNQIFSSYSKTLVSPDEWPEFRLIYTKIEEKEKKIKSRPGMKSSVQTCPIYNDWVEYEEKTAMPAVIKAVKEKDFPTFAKLAMQCSDGLHAVMGYTYPRILYLNEKSQELIDAVNELNAGEMKAAYTYDAGPNAIVFTLEKYENQVIEQLSRIIPKENIAVTRLGKGSRITKVEK